MDHRQQINYQIKTIRKNLSEGLPFAAEQRALALVDLIRELPEVEKYRVHKREKLTRRDYLTSTPDA
jgi:hypothetical protein